MAPELEQMRVLLVDDEAANLVVLKGMLQRAGFRQVLSCEEPERTVELFDEFQPDLLILDQHMPRLSGTEVLGALAGRLPSSFPVLMISADERSEVKERALASGASDFITKPFQATEVLLRVRNMLDAWRIRMMLEHQNELLEERVRERTEALERSQLEMLVRLARAAEYRDDESGEHVWRVARGCALLADALGEPTERVELLMRAARLHDVGKIVIPDGILLKPGRLTPAEYEVVKSHTTVGHELLSGSHSPLMQLAAELALTHHERWDGKGYPQGLKGEEIPLAARVLAVIDAFDALTHDRIHARAITPAAAVAEIQGHAGSQFDPEVVAGFMGLFARGEIPVS